MAIFMISELSVLPKEKSLSHENRGLNFGEFCIFAVVAGPALEM